MKAKTTTRLAALESRVAAQPDPEQWSLPVQVVDLETGKKIGAVHYLPRTAQPDYRNALHLVAPID